MDEEPKYRKALGLITDALTVPVTVKLNEEGTPIKVVVGWKPADLSAMISS